MDKHLIRIAINDIMDAHCEHCEIVKGNRSPNAKINELCADCPHYKQIRQLGNQLLKRSEPKMKMSVEEYKAFKLKKMNIEEIAKAKQVSPATVYNWKKAHKSEIEAPVIKKAIAVVPLENDQNQAENVQKTAKNVQNPNHSVSEKLSVRVKEQQKIIAKLQTEAAGNQRQIDALVADKKKLLEEKQTHNGADETIARTERYAKKIAALEKEKADLLKSTQNQAQTIEVLQKNLSSSSSLYQEKSKAVIDLNAAADDLESEISKLKESNAYLNKAYGKEISEHSLHMQQLRAAMNFIHELTAK